MEKSANEHGNWTGHSFVSHFVLARMGRVGREALTRNIKEELSGIFFNEKNFAFTKLKERVSLLCCERLTRLYFFFICDFAAMGVDVLDTSVAVFGVFKRY